MKIVCSIAALLLIHLPTVKPTENKSTTILEKNDCPTWMHPVIKNISNKRISQCVCGIDHQLEILCDSKTNTLRIVDGLAMTYDDKTDRMIAGYALYGLSRQKYSRGYSVYRKIPLNKSEVSKHMCRGFHRTGQLCGECEKNRTPQIYTYDFHCKHCTSNNWTSFICATFLPLTVFYIIALLFKFNANSPAIHAFVLASQLLYTPQIIRFYLMQSNLNRIRQVFIVMYGVWNMDFLTLLDTTFCLQISTLQALALSYVFPSYALVLIIITYIVIELHSHGCKLLISIYSLFRKCFNIKCHYKSSMIDVFSTFLLLSYNRLLSTHYDLLIYTNLFDQYGKNIGKFLYYSPTTEYFKGAHLWVGMVALTIFVFCTLFPFALLLLYPMKCFQRCLNAFKLNRNGLRIFADSFIGCYKDGTEPGTRDCRYFAALFLFLRILMYATLSATTATCAIAINGIIIMLFLAVFSVYQPYKAKFAVYNKVTIVMLAVMSATYMAFLGVLLSSIMYTSKIHWISFVLIVCVYSPQLYFVALILKWMCSFACTCACTPKSDLEELRDQYEAL